MTTAAPTVVLLSRIPKLAEAVHAASKGVIQTVALDPTSPDLEVLKSAEVVLGDPGLFTDPVLDSLQGNCKWLASTWAGVEKVLAKIDAAAPPPWRLTRFAGYFGPAMADYVCSHILARERHSGHFMKLQEAKRWENVHDSPGYRLINTLSVGVMGVGEIGKEIATVCKGMGMSVSGMVRTKPSEADAVDGMTYYTTDELPLLLQSSDYVVNVLPSTPSTIGLLNGGMLANCKPKASCLINVGRGDIVDEAELLRAIDAKDLGGAVLDVFQTEPLPETSRLWDTEGIVITPHVAAISFPEDVAAAFASNMERYQNGSPDHLKHQVNFSSGY